MNELRESFADSGAEDIGLCLITNLHELKRTTIKDLVSSNREDGSHFFPIFPHEWKDRANQIYNHIASYTSSKYRVYARKCMVTDISRQQARAFCDLYHIQGTNPLFVKGWGIFHNKELLGILSLGRHHRNIPVMLLDRLCFKREVQVVGGATKLFSAAKSWAGSCNVPEIVSFSDNRWSTGNVYKAMEFTLDKELSPDYFYVDKNDYCKFYSKQSQKKSNTGCPSHITESEWAKRHGLLRVYDAGKKRWSITISEEVKLRRIKQPLSCRRQGYHTSSKAGIIYWQSSYELKAAIMLDDMDEVLTYNTQVGFNYEGRERRIDFLVTLSNGSVKIIEIKPIRRLEKFKDQIQDNRLYAKKNSWIFEIWTEKDLGFKSEYFATKWADDYLSKVKDVNFVEERKAIAKKKMKRYYQKHIAKDTVTFWCGFCKTEHTQLRKTHESNVAKNGRHICIKENGVLQGQKPCKHKGNPYAAEGKKKCNGPCGGILLLAQFGKDKSRVDGHASRCKKCRTKSAMAKYNGK